MSLLLLWPLLSPVSIASSLRGKKKKLNLVWIPRREGGEDRCRDPLKIVQCPQNSQLLRSESCSTEVSGIKMWNKYQSSRLFVNSHHVCQSPVWNCILWGFWFPCCSCAQEMKCSSDTFRLLEQMLLSSRRGVFSMFAHLWRESCLDNKSDLKVWALKAEGNRFGTLQYSLMIRAWIFAPTQRHLLVWRHQEPVLSAHNMLQPVKPESKDFPYLLPLWKNKMYLAVPSTFSFLEGKNAH